ncbi:MAG: hypothetical protein JWP67_1759 [Mucilaginibacter sp.]|jgi:hypothetical protein|nr:hypothetical protein [Mucilaginibacter sp.]MDB5061916.1 hypothetical protein [Mucilaginibacter sp.]
MVNEIILKKIIASYCFAPIEQINLNLEIKDNYVAAELKDKFANSICYEWRALNCNQLHDELFEKLKTGNDVLKLIKVSMS